MRLTMEYIVFCGFPDCNFWTLIYLSHISLLVCVILSSTSLYINVKHIRIAIESGFKQFKVMNRKTRKKKKGTALYYITIYRCSCRS